MGVSLVYFVMSALVKWQGKHLLNRLFPPVVIGPVIILIGLTLSSAGVNMAKTNWLLAAISLATAVVVLTFGKGLIKFGSCCMWNYCGIYRCNLPKRSEL